jgi:hypothetical protein
MTTPSLHARRRAVLAALIAAGLVSLPACGSAETPPASGGQPRNQVSEQDFSSARDAYDLELAGCLRGKGLDVKDPQPGQGIQESSPEIAAAASKCMAELGDPPSVAMSKADEAELRKVQLEQAACLRGKGYDVKDPSPQEALTDPEDATQEDVDACFAG